MLEVNVTQDALILHFVGEWAGEHAGQEGLSIPALERLAEACVQDWVDWIHG
jgi:hypothetical protein